MKVYIFSNPREKIRPIEGMDASPQDLTESGSPLSPELIRQAREFLADLKNPRSRLNRTRVC
jgi:hypothetical protein